MTGLRSTLESAQSSLNLVCKELFIYFLQHIIQLYSRGTWHAVVEDKKSKANYMCCERVHVLYSGSIRYGIGVPSWS